MMMDLSFSLLMYLTGLLVFSYKSKHILLMLLSLEFIVVSIYFGLYITFYCYDYENFFLMIFLTMSVCEGALGLSILIILIRCYGNDYFSSFNILW